jgi:hypothetical protein
MTTWYHVYEETGSDAWKEVRNPNTTHGRWFAPTNLDATTQARREVGGRLFIFPGEPVLQLMAIAQHRVRTFPISLQDDRPFDDGPVE